MTLRRLLPFGLAALVATVALGATTYTTNYNLGKPGDGDDDYGETIRDNFDTIDAQMKLNADSVSAHSSDASAAHQATAISAAAGSTLCTAADDVQEFLDCLDDATANYVTLTGTQTLTDKTLTEPVIDDGELNDPVILGGTMDSTAIGSGTPDTAVFTTATATTLNSSGGALNGTVGATTPASGAFTTLSATSATIDGGAVNATAIGNVSPSTGAFTTLSGSNLTATTATISAGTVNNATVGATTPAAGTFTALTANTSLKILEGGGTPTHFTTFQGADQAGAIVYTLPPDDGGANQVLQTDGSGVLTWVNASSGGDVVGPGASNDGEIVLFDADTGALVKAATGTGVVHATSGVYSTGTVAVSEGGTGQTTATAAFNALDPLTTVGDLIAYNGTNTVRLPVGTDGDMLTANSGAATGLSWTTPLANPMDSEGDLIVGGAAGVTTKLDSGTSGYFLASAGAASPVWTELLPIANGGTNKALTLSAGGIPWTDADSFEILAAGSAGQILTSGGAATPAWVTLVPMANGGTNKAATAVNGGIVWSDADSMEITAAGTSGQILLSGGAATPFWSGVPDGKILVGNASNLPVAVTPSGDVTMTNAGVTAIGAGVIVNADVNASAAIDGSKIVAATGAVAGVVTTASQTFAGDKTFNGVLLGPAGSATAPTHSFSTDPNTGIFSVSDNVIGFATAGVKRISLGTNTLSIDPVIRASDGSVGTPAYSFSNDTDTGIFSAAAGNITFSINGSETAELDATTFRVGGKIGANSTATSYFHTVLNTFSSANGFGLRVQDTDTSGTSTNILSQMDFAADDDATGAYLMEFTDSGGQIGAIKVASATAVSYNTTSDGRLKKDVRPITDGIARIKKVEPRYYRWIENNAEDEGFIAQELYESVPKAVSGTPSDDVKVSPMSVDYGRLTPILTAAIKELIAQNEALTARVAALEAMTQ